MSANTAASGGNVFEDLSGVSSTTSGNPYDALLSLCQNDQVASILFFLRSLLIEAFGVTPRRMFNGVPYAQNLASP